METKSVVKRLNLTPMEKEKFDAIIKELTTSVKKSNINLRKKLNEQHLAYFDASNELIAKLTTFLEAGKKILSITSSKERQQFQNENAQAAAFKGLEKKTIQSTISAIEWLQDGGTESPPLTYNQWYRLLKRFAREFQVNIDNPKDKTQDQDIGHVTGVVTIKGANWIAGLEAILNSYEGEDNVKRALQDVKAKGRNVYTAMLAVDGYKEQLVGDIDKNLQTLLESLPTNININQSIETNVAIARNKIGGELRLTLEAAVKNRYAKAALQGYLIKILETVMQGIETDLSKDFIAKISTSPNMLEEMRNQFAKMFLGKKVTAARRNKQQKRKYPLVGYNTDITTKARANSRKFKKALNSAVNVKMTKTTNAVNNSQRTITLFTLLKAKLPETVRANMGEPGLVNRSGRFADSTTITDVVITAQGHPSVGYSYQQDPYQVFEMTRGTPPWATLDRDPRKLIDKSIREIAAQMFTGRLYTRRV